MEIVKRPSPWGVRRGYEKELYDPETKRSAVIAPDPSRADMAFLHLRRNENVWVRIQHTTRAVAEVAAVVWVTKGVMQ